MSWQRTVSVSGSLRNRTGLPGSSNGTAMTSKYGQAGLDPLL